MLNCSIHGTSSSNCIAAVRVSKPVHSGIVIRKPVIAPVSASQRCAGASLSPPVSSTPRPNRIGTQIASERSGAAVIGIRQPFGARKRNQVMPSRMPDSISTAYL
jgi:hypothetical protein